MAEIRAREWLMCDHEWSEKLVTEFVRHTMSATIKDINQMLGRSAAAQRRQHALYVIGTAISEAGYKHYANRIRHYAGSAPLELPDAGWQLWCDWFREGCPPSLRHTLAKAVKKSKLLRRK